MPDELAGMPEKQVLVTYVYKLQPISEFRDLEDVPALGRAADVRGSEGEVTKVTTWRKDGVDVFQVQITELA